MVGIPISTSKGGRFGEGMLVIKLFSEPKEKSHFDDFLSFLRNSS